MIFGLFPADVILDALLISSGIRVFPNCFNISIPGCCGGKPEMATNLEELSRI
jgi:hypothetical protein